MLKLNHKNKYVYEMINELESNIANNNVEFDKEVDIITDTVIRITYHCKGYRWTVEHCFNINSLAFTYHHLVDVWQLDGCPNPIFEV